MGSDEKEIITMGKCQNVEQNLWERNVQCHVIPYNQLGLVEVHRAEMARFAAIHFLCVAPSQIWVSATHYFLLLSGFLCP